MGTPTLCVTTHTHTPQISPSPQSPQPFGTPVSDSSVSFRNRGTAKQPNEHEMPDGRMTPACVPSTCQCTSLLPPGGLAVYEACSMEVMARRGPGWAAECVCVCMWGGSNHLNKLSPCCYSLHLPSRIIFTLSVIQ